jgi:hypothetical protein
MPLPWRLPLVEQNLNSLNIRHRHRDFNAPWVAPAISLAEARQKAAGCCTMRTNKIDPIEAREAELKRAQRESGTRCDV